MVYRYYSSIIRLACEFRNIPKNVSAVFIRALIPNGRHKNAGEHMVGFYILIHQLGRG